MQPHPVQSSLIAAVSYAAASQQLDVWLHNGIRYRYYGVPPATYQQLLRADSKGRFFNSAIKPNFSFERLGGYSPPFSTPGQRGFFGGQSLSPSRPRPARARRGFFDD